MEWIDYVITCILKTSELRTNHKEKVELKKLITFYSRSLNPQKGQILILSILVWRNSKFS